MQQHLLFCTLFFSFVCPLIRAVPALANQQQVGDAKFEHSDSEKKILPAPPCRVGSGWVI